VMVAALFCPAAILANEHNIQAPVNEDENELVPQGNRARRNIDVGINWNHNNHRDSECDRERRHTCSFGTGFCVNYCQNCQRGSCWGECHGGQCQCVHHHNRCDSYNCCTRCGGSNHDCNHHNRG